MITVKQPFLFDSFVGCPFQVLIYFILLSKFYWSALFFQVVKNRQLSWFVWFKVDEGRFSSQSRIITLLDMDNELHMAFLLCIEHVNCFRRWISSFVLAQLRSRRALKIVSWVTVDVDSDNNLECSSSHFEILYIWIKHGMGKLWNGHYTGLKHFQVCIFVSC